MLLLGRNDGEEIYINGGFENGGITIKNCSNSRCRIGILAPSNVLVHRKELHDQKNLEKTPDQKPV